MISPKRWLSVRNLLMVSGAITTLAQANCGSDMASALGALPATYPAQGYASYGPYMGEGAIPIGYPRQSQDVWAWPERTYALDRVFYDTPPDYGFNYNGYQPFVWRTGDDWTMYADPYDNGRYYYYEPGSQRPYFIRDNQYGYGFDDAGRLIGVFSLLGALMPNSFLGTQAPVAGDYYRRAYDMRRYGLSAQPLTIAEPVWAARRPVIVDDFNHWLRAAQAEPWADYRLRTDGRLVRAFDDEVKRRKAHPGFPAHAKGWGPPFLRDGDRRVVIASVTEPSVVVVERDRDRRRGEDRVVVREERGRDDGVRFDDRGRDRADRSSDSRGPDRDRAGRRDENPGQGRAQREERPQQQAKPDNGKGRNDRDRGGEGKGRDDRRVDKGPDRGNGGNGKGKNG